MEVQPKNQLLLFGLGGGILMLILIGFTVGVVAYEQKYDKTKTGPLPTVNPTPTVSPTPAPTPPPTYEPLTSTISKNEAIDIFLEVSKYPPSSENDKIVRWEREKIPVALRGQPTPEDAQCLQSIVSELNPVMETSQLVITSEKHPGLLEMYLLPQDQFSSVNVDTPTDRQSVNFLDASASQIYQWRSLINSEQPPTYRCTYLRTNMLRSLGQLQPTKAAIPQSYISDGGPVLGSSYTPYDLEIIHIMYSKFVFSGLTASEAEKRLRE